MKHHTPDLFEVEFNLVAQAQTAPMPVRASDPQPSLFPVEEVRSFGPTKFDRLNAARKESAS